MPAPLLSLRQRSGQDGSALGVALIYATRQEATHLAADPTGDQVRVVTDVLTQREELNLPL